MAVAANNMVMDGDPAFHRVDTRTPPHQLPPGVCADATNKRFEDGRAWPRFGTTQQPWGQPIDPISTIPTTANYSNIGNYGLFGKLIPGARYVLTIHSAGTPANSQYQAGGNNNNVGLVDPVNLYPKSGQPYYFTAPGDSLFFIDLTKINQPVNATLYLISFFQNPCGYVRFNDPNGFDTTVLLTDDWRDGAGEDGGRGRAWKIQSGNAPVQVPMNGNDIYGTSRLIACFNGLVMLRQDNERHYFQAAAIAASQIQLNCEPDWNSGDAVFLWGDPTVNTAFTAGANPPALQQQVFVKNVGGNKVELYSDPLLANKYVFTAAMGRFYLERQATLPGPFGNGAWPLLAQPGADGSTLWQEGFEQVPPNLEVTATIAATGIWTVPNHRLNAGDEVALTGMAGGDTPANGNYYVFPLSDHQLQLFDTEDHALAAASGSVVGLEAINIVGASVPVLTKAGASGLPMPPAREGYYTDNNQLVLVNGANGIFISDPLDPLHYEAFTNQLTANLGESDSVVAIAEITSSDTLIFLKTNSICALYNFSEGSQQWALRSVTREYGCAAPLSVRQWGSNLMFLSRRGLDRVEYTAFGVIVGVDKPVSYDMQKYINLIDWNNADMAVTETWNNRLFFVYPAKGQQQGDVQNNAWLSLNFLNTDLRKGDFGWEGGWSGAALNAFALARLDVYGEERLTFVNYSGQVCWLDDGWLDLGTTAISDSLTTRRYTGNTARKIWQKARCIWDTNNPLLTVSVVTPGWNEISTLTPAGGLSYDRTQYVAGEGPAYNPATQQPPFNNPFREDYSLAGPGELIGGQPDVHQNITETFRMREDDWGVQLVIANARGCCRLVSVEVEGFMGPGAGTRTV